MVKESQQKDFSLESFLKTYDTDQSDVKVRGRHFHFYLPKTLEGFIDSEDPLRDFPLWAKLWEASLVLADYLAGMTVEPEMRFLEIGAGVGLVSIIAERFGHGMTMTEYNPQALAFARANALLNHCTNLQIVKLDWNDPDLDGRFDYIVGSEVVYLEKDFKPLLNLFDSLLKPGGEILLSAELRKTNVEFFRQMQESFKIEARKKRLRSSEKDISLVLCRMIPRRPY